MTAVWAEMTGPNGPYRQILPGLYLDRDGAAGHTHLVKVREKDLVGP